MAGSLRRTHALWPAALALGVRLGVWLLVPASRFASDEDSYFQLSTTLLAQGRQDLFWPPITGWLIALVRWVMQTDSLAVVRLVWIGFDVACVLAVQRLARVVADAAWPRAVERADRVAALAAAAYAVYLPAVSHAQFVTSETPALLQTLLVLLLLTGARPGPGTFAVAGLLAGTLALTRPSLLPLLVVLPAAAVLGGRIRAVAHAMIFVVAGSCVVGGYASRNWLTSGDFTLSHNSAYNLYIGNRDLYAEDLNLFDPRATAGQIEFRRQQWSGELVYPTESPAELQRLAFQWIAAHPAEFARRALGRLARVFVPRTDVLELIGGERQAGIFSPQALAVLAVANIQWAVVLFGGLVGLAALARMDRSLGLIFGGTIVGALVLCAVAISKPRYSFVFDPLLLIGAVLFMTAPRETWGRLGRRDRWWIGAAFGFVLWAWAAFTIFAVSSRTAP